MNTGRKPSQRFDLPSRQVLKYYDPAICEILAQIVHEPEAVMRSVFHETISDLQANLKACGVLSDRVLDTSKLPNQGQIQLTRFGS